MTGCANIKDWNPPQASHLDSSAWLNKGLSSTVEQINSPFLFKSLESEL